MKWTVLAVWGSFATLILTIDLYLEATVVALVVALLCLVLAYAEAEDSGTRLRVVAGWISLLAAALYVRSLSPLCSLAYVTHGHHNGEPPVWLYTMCPSPRVEPNCPLFPFPLLTQYVDGANTASGPVLLSETALETLSRLEGPLYLLSEAGEFNTGKSFRQSVYIRSLVPRHIRAQCPSGVGFEVRDDDEGLVGKTRGVWLLPITLAWLEADSLTPNLRRALQRMTNGRVKQGHLIFIDTEGDNEPAGAGEAAGVRMQLLVLSLSSHVSLSMPSHVTANKLKHVATLFRLLQLSETMAKAASECRAVTDGGSAATDAHGNPVQSLLFSTPSVSIVVKNSEALLPVNKNLTVDRQTQQVVAIKDVTDPRTLNMAAALDALLEKQANATGATSEDAAYIRQHIRNVPYLPSITPYDAWMHWLPWLGWERETIAVEESRSQLPSAYERRFPPGMHPPYGLVFGLTRFVLPSILERASPKAINDVPDASGAVLASFVRSSHNTMALLEDEWLESLGVKALGSKMCATAGRVVDGWQAAEVRALNTRLPVESQPPCANSQLCSMELFNASWSSVASSLNNDLCLISTMMGAAAFESCFVHSLLPRVNSEYSLLLARNAERCQYQWEKSDFSGVCEGACPGFQSRSVVCRNKQSELRPDTCCKLYLGGAADGSGAAGGKPDTKLSCELWTYGWKEMGWSACSQGHCGQQTRKVECAAASRAAARRTAARRG